MIESLDALGREAGAAVAQVLARVAASVEPEYREAVLEDVRAYLADHLDAGATAADVTELARTVGDPGLDPADRTSWLGRLPIDLAPPSAEKVAYTWWNPRDRRLFVPRVFGLGWSLNFGAAAVKLGLIEPDAEDEPFESTPTPAFRAAVLVPATLAAAVGAHYLFRWRGLPDRLPSQLGTTGRVDRWTSKAAAASVDVAVATVPTLWAGVLIGRGATGARAAGSVAAATSAASIAAGLTLWRTAAVDGKPRPWAGPGLLALLWLPAGALLLTLARLGRDAELRNDLGKKE
jgi:hypothetical protein